MAEKTLTPAEFAQQSREEVENFAIKASIQAYLLAKKSVESVRHSITAIGVEPTTEMWSGMEMAVKTIFHKLQLTDRFRKITYIEYDENNLMTENGVFRRDAFPQANETNTLTVAMMEKINATDPL